MTCDFDLEGQALYSVKWYKNGQEFFRYMRDKSVLRAIWKDRLFGSFFGPTSGYFSMLQKCRKRTKIFPGSRIFFGCILVSFQVVFLKQAVFGRNKKEWGFRNFEKWQHILHLQKEHYQLHSHDFSEPLCRENKTAIIRLLECTSKFLKI